MSLFPLQIFVFVHTLHATCFLSKLKFKIEMSVTVNSELLSLKYSASIDNRIDFLTELFILYQLTTTTRLENHWSYCSATLGMIICAIRCCVISIIFLCKKLLVAIHYTSSMKRYRLREYTP